MHRKGMKIFRLVSDWETIEGDADDLEEMGFISSLVRNAVYTGKPYRGYVCTVIGVRGESVNTAPVKKITVEEFNNMAIAEGKTYAELQLEETMGRKVCC